MRTALATALAALIAAAAVGLGLLYTFVVYAPPPNQCDSVQDAGPTM